MPVHVNALKGSVDAVVLTIRKDEDRAVADLIGKLEPTIGGRSYRVARLEGETGTLTIALLRLTEAGNGPAQDAARDAIAELAPRMLVLVGIAGAVPTSEFTLGDVMVATRIADMRVQALVPDTLPQLEVRGERVHKALADRLNNLIELQGWTDAVMLPRPPAPLEPDLLKGSAKWNEKITRSIEALFHSAGHRARPIYFTATVGSSDFLIRDPAALAHWLQSSRKIETVEMEAAGVMDAAARLDATYPVLVVRGISDIVGYEREPAWTAYACQSAAAFAVALLRSGQVDDIRPYRLGHLVDVQAQSLTIAASPATPRTNTTPTQGASVHGEGTQASALATDEDVFRSSEDCASFLHAPKSLLSLGVPIEHVDFTLAWLMRGCNETGRIRPQSFDKLSGTHIHEALAPSMKELLSDAREALARTHRDWFYLSKKKISEIYQEHLLVLQQLGLNTSAAGDRLALLTRYAIKCKALVHLPTALLSGEPISSVPSSLVHFLFFFSLQRDDLLRSFPELEDIDRLRAPDISSRIFTNRDPNVCPVLTFEARHRDRKITMHCSRRHLLFYSGITDGMGNLAAGHFVPISGLGYVRSSSSGALELHALACAFSDAVGLSAQLEGLR